MFAEEMVTFVGGPLDGQRRQLTKAGSDYVHTDFDRPIMVNAGWPWAHVDYPRHLYVRQPRSDGAVWYVYRGESTPAN